MKLYDELASWWPLVSPPADYAEEAGVYLQMLRAAVSGPLREVLELGSGGGHNASHMKAALALTLVEPAPAMRAVSEALNPECRHVAGDMRTVRLGRTFDAVFVHDAIEYMTSETDLQAALETVALHLRPGGAALVAPDATAESFAAGVDCEEHYEDLGGTRSGRAVAYLEWTPSSGPGAGTRETHYLFLLRERDGSVRTVHDVHRCGVFPRATWLRLFSACGLEARLEPRHLDGADYDTFVAVRPG